MRGAALPNDDDNPNKTMTMTFGRQRRRWQQWWGMKAMTRPAAVVDDGRQRQRTKTAYGGVYGDGGGDNNCNSDRRHMQQKWMNARLLITKKTMQEHRRQRMGRQEVNLVRYL